MGANIHHHNAVARAEKKLGVANDAGAIVRDTVEEEDPVAVRLRCANFPAAKDDTVGSTHLEILAMGGDARKGSVGEPDLGRSEGLPNRVKNAASKEPARTGSEAQENQNSR